MAKEIVLGNGRIVFVDDEDFKRLAEHVWQYQKGKNENGYAFRKIQSAFVITKIYMHREIMNVPKGAQVDHIDGNGLNNQKANLRVATQQQNNANMRARSATGYKGVCWHESRKKWRSHIKVNGKFLYLGRYDTLEEAARAYDVAAFKHFGEFALLNFPTVKG